MGGDQGSSRWPKSLTGRSLLLASLGLNLFTVARLLQVENDPGEQAATEQHNHDGAKAQCPLRRHGTSLEINLFILLQRV